MPKVKSAKKRKSSKLALRHKKNKLERYFEVRPRGGYIKIGVSGAALGETVAKSADKAEELGRQIALHGCVLVNGATSGLPYYSAKGADEAGGITIGYSPAATELEHVRAYRLPTDHMDMIIYTGFNYSGRNLIFTRGADAVIIVGGRVGTLNEFTIAFEDHKVIGILTESGGISDEIDHILTVAKRGRKHVFFDSDPASLIKTVVNEVKKSRSNGKRDKHFHDVASRIQDQ